MEPDLEPPNPTSNGDHDDYDIADESNCSTPFVSAPSSPGRYFPSSGIGAGFFYSAPASPVHYVLTTAPARSSAGGLTPAASDVSSNGSFEFEFSARFDSPEPEIGSSMCSADELFLNGQIRPMKLSAHLQRPQPHAPFPFLDLCESERENGDEDEDEDDVFQRSRDLKLRDRSQRRRARSLSPLRSTTPFDWFTSDDVVSTPKKEVVDENGGSEKKEPEMTSSGSASSSRCSSAGRSSKRWIFLKDFLRSKSEGRSNNKFWHNLSFSPAKEKKEKVSCTASFSDPEKAKKLGKETPAKKSAGKPSPAPAKRRSAHELHYTANRAQAEEMRKKTFLPYRQGLVGCLGFNSKSYGALSGLAKALNPVSSR